MNSILLDLIGIYEILHPTRECTMFSSLYGIFSNIYIPHFGAETHFNKFKVVEVKLPMFSDYMGIKLKSKP